MTEVHIPQVEKTDIVFTPLEPGGTALVLQRHERYDRNRDAEGAGSLLPEDAAAARDRDLAYFTDVFDNETDGAETMFLFVSSDTQYAGKGRRSLETGQIAQDAAIDVMRQRGIDPDKRIINLNTDFVTSRTKETDQDIRPVAKLREPQIFETPEYVDFLRTKYGAEKDGGSGLSPQAWGVHEGDEEKDTREAMGAEGVFDMLGRTQDSVRILQRYAKLFHAKNPDKRLVIWATTHYDTISPFVKDATNTPFTEYVPVDYGGGVVINMPPNSDEAILNAHSQQVALDLGRVTTKSAG